jgi:hypothetical protein
MIPLSSLSVAASGESYSVEPLGRCHKLLQRRQGSISFFDPLRTKSPAMVDRNCLDSA